MEAAGGDGLAVEEGDRGVGDGELEGGVVGEGGEEGEGVGLWRAGVHEFGVAGPGAVGEGLACFDGAEKLVGPADVLVSVILSLAACLQRGTEGDAAPCQ